MATNSDRIDDLTRLAARSEALLESVEGRLSRAEEKLGQKGDEWAAAAGRADTRLAVVERDVADLKARRDEWGRRLWALVGPILGVAIGAVATYLLRR